MVKSLKTRTVLLADQTQLAQKVYMVPIRRKRTASMLHKWPGSLTKKMLKQVEGKSQVNMYNLMADGTQRPFYLETSFAFADKISVW